MPPLRSLLLVPCVAAGCVAPPDPTERTEAPLAWVSLATPGRASLRGIAVVDAATVWVTGTGGAVWRTQDGGGTWQDVSPEGSAAWDLRDVAAFDAEHALVMVAGEPARVLRTEDGGAHWRVVHADPRPGAFFDGLAFRGDAGVLFGDPLDGAFCLWTSTDAGRTWTAVPASALPAPLPNEAAFAASGSSVAATGEPGAEVWWVATGGGPRARLLRGDARGWTVADLPLRAGAASQGAFGLASRGSAWVAVGGDYAEPMRSDGTAAVRPDAGAAWSEVPGGAGGFRSAAVWLDDDTVLAVGSHGTSRSKDRGRSWSLVLGPGFHALGASPDGVVYACGSDGRVARLARAGP